MDGLSFKEYTEYEIILNKLHLDVNIKKEVASYLFNQNVDKIIDNYNQAKGGMSCMENRLAKFGKTEEFNRQFQVNIDMGVFQKLAKKEMDT
jgi:hypothetical protein